MLDVMRAMAQERALNARLVRLRSTLHRIRLGEYVWRGLPGRDTNSQRQSVQWVGRRCLLAICRSCAAGYDGRASVFAGLRPDKAARPYRLEQVPIIIGKWYERMPAWQRADLISFVVAG